MEKNTRKSKTTEKVEEIKSVEDYVVVEICAGAGGLSTGLIQAGLKVGLAIEIDEIASATYKRNHPNTEVWTMDISYVTGKSIISFIRFKYGNKKIILAGGPPCQSWSGFKEEDENSKKGYEDKRGRLLFQYLRICEEIQPSITIFENVSYLVEDRHLKDFQEFKEAMSKKTGLTLYYRVLNAIDYGVAQLRNRVIMIGVKKSFFNPFIFLKPIEGPKTLREQLQNCPPSEADYFSSHAKEIMKKIPEGNCWNVLPPEIAIKSMKVYGKNKYRGICNKCQTQYEPQNGNCPKCGAQDFRNGYGVTSFWRRLSWDKPCFTICTVSPIKEHGTLAHPDVTQNRGLSWRECARIQGFPDTYEFAGDLANKYRQIGNAVAVPMAKAIGLAIRDAITSTQAKELSFNEWIEKLKTHPERSRLTTLEKDFLNTLYKKIRTKQSIPPKYRLYIEETWRRISG